MSLIVLLLPTMYYVALYNTVTSIIPLLLSFTLLIFY